MTTTTEALQDFTRTAHTPLAAAMAARTTTVAANDDDAFHAFRKTGIGGSDSAAALGMSKWKSPFGLWQEKVGETAPEPENEAMRFGKILEPIVIGEYERKTGYRVERDLSVTRIRHETIPYMIANLDGLVVTDASRRVIEAKTARGGWNESQWGEPGTDGVPITHLLQATHNMIVAGTDVCDIPVLIGGSDFRIYTVNRNAKLVELVLQGEQEFWKCVTTRTPPSPRTLEEVNERFRKSTSGDAVLFDDEVADACRKLRVAKDDIKRIEAESAEFEFAIKQALGASEVGLIDGIVACTWKSNKPSRVFNAKRFVIEQPEVAAVYMEDKTGNRPLLLKV